MTPAVAPLVVLVTDPRRDLATTSRVIREAAASLGPQRLLVQLRDKESDDAGLLVTARALRDVTRAAAALFVVNGNVRVAQAALADGVHLPGAVDAAAVAAARELLGGGAIVTVPAHDDDDVGRAVAAGASAVLVSPIFDALGKGPPRGMPALAAARAIVDAARHPTCCWVFALGGVTRDNAAACLENGADGVAAIRALYDDRDALLAALARGPRP